MKRCEICKKLVIDEEIVCKRCGHTFQNKSIVERIQNKELSENYGEKYFKNEDDEVVEIIETLENIEYGGFWVRTLACIIDFIFVMLFLYFFVNLIIHIPGVIKLNADGNVDFFIFKLLWIIGIFFICFLFLYLKQTIGQKLLGLKIKKINKDGNLEDMSRTGLILYVIAWFFVKFVSYINIPILILNSRKQGLHNLMNSTVVIRKQSK